MEKAETESKLETLRRTIGEGFNKALDTIPKLIPQVKDAFITMETQMSDPQTIDRLANDAAQQVNNVWFVECTAYCIYTGQYWPSLYRYFRLFLSQRAILRLGEYKSLF